ncbi:hypothetical protein GMRT_12566 [Giardia muris]|uniref:Uncharacterized protein n=1 Tax=Giardia muris TaxID=5742 RepID=A0A4Z1SRA8_GIAMU|nr:hypothetical protein GMRT_12566 [Giardia muris]|eukprot:TNJ28434.1 hypothetical protein GMRT_12566 [Giardia muris]
MTLTAERPPPHRLPSLSGLRFLSRCRRLEDGMPAVLLLFATWSLACREALEQLLIMQNTQRNVFFFAVSVEGPDVLHTWARKFPILHELNVASDSSCTLKPFLDSHGLNSVPTGVIFRSDRRLIWSGHPLSLEFSNAFHTMLAREHIRTSDDERLMFMSLRATLRSPVLRSGTASPVPISAALSASSSNLSLSQLTEPAVSLSRPRQKPTSSLSIKGTLPSSPLIEPTSDRNISSRPNGRRTSPLPRSKDSEKSVPDSTRTSPFGDKNNEKEPRRTTSRTTRSLPPIEGVLLPTVIPPGREALDCSNVRYVAEDIVRPDPIRSRTFVRASSPAERARQEYGWMLMKPELISPSPQSIPSYYPTNIASNIQNAEKLFERSTSLLRHISPAQRRDPGH